MDNAALNPALVVVARESREWLQRDLARALDTTQATVSKYENGSIGMPKSHVLAAADALRFDQGFFYQTDMVYGLGGDFLYRRRANVGKTVRRRVEAEANILKMQTERLLRSADIETAFPFPAIEPGELDNRVDLVAAEVRRIWRIPDGPIRNLTRVIEHAGGIVFALDYQGAKIDGTNIRTATLPPMLFLNRNVSGDRHRFNLAHEVGHVVMHFTSAMEDAEAQANAFAAEFLMPKRLIRSDLRSLDLPAAARLKEVWGASMAAIVRRAFELKQISESKYRRLNTSLRASGQATQEFYPISFEEPQSFENLKRFHVDSLGYDQEQMQRLLFVTELGPIDTPSAKPTKLRLVGGPSLFEDN